MERFGDWQLEALIAVGGLGEVWRATQGDRTRALKRLHTHLARNEEGRTQFAVEQQLATTLPRHPNVVHADEVGDVDGRPYIALELAPGEDLRRLIAPPVTKANPAPPKVLLTRARARDDRDRARAGQEHLGRRRVGLGHRWCDQPAEVFPGSELERDVRAAVDVPDLVGVDDVGVARQRRGELLLDGELGSALLVAREVRVQPLERARAIALRRAPDLAEAPDRDQRLELPVPEPLHRPSAYLSLIHI